jgi:Na+/H+-dicarboxylate symporter
MQQINRGFLIGFCLTILVFAIFNGCSCNVKMNPQIKEDISIGSRQSIIDTVVNYSINGAPYIDSIYIIIDSNLRRV